METTAPKTTRQKLIREVKEMLWIFLYLALFFCTFTIYRQLILNDSGVASYYHYGFALLKAAVLAKVILLGQHTRIARRLDERPLIVPTLYKVVVFSLFTLIFEILEHAVGSLLHHKPAIDAIEEILSAGKYQLLAGTLVVIFALLPLLAFTEIGRVLGEGKMYELFFRNPSPPVPERETSSA